MPDMTYECKSHLSTPVTDAAETGGRVDPESASHPSYLLVIPVVIPEDMKTLRRWVGWKAASWPAKHTKKPWSKVPKNPETGCHADPTARRTWGAFDQALASYRFVDRSIPLMLPVSHAEMEALSRQGRVISVRGGLSHG
jgi:hypothetical protein